MTLIRGVPGAVDDVGSAWENDIEDDRARIWDAFGRRQGVISGFDMFLDGGSLSVTFDGGTAVVEERGTNGIGNGRAYHLYQDLSFQVTFEAPDASSRNDAVVFCWADPQYGVLGAAVDPPGGPQVVVVKGTAGVTTPTSDTDLQTAIGPGGWFRYADVIIDPGDTQPNPANVTTHAPSAGEVFLDATVDGTQSVAVNTTERVLWPTTVEAVGGIAVSGSEIQNLPPGLYDVSVAITGDGTTEANFSVELHKNTNGTPGIPLAQVWTLNPATGQAAFPDRSATLTKTVRVADGDHLEVFVTLGSGAVDPLVIRATSYLTVARRR